MHSVVLWPKLAQESATTLRGPLPRESHSFESTSPFMQDGSLPLRTVSPSLGADESSKSGSTAPNLTEDAKGMSIGHFAAGTYFGRGGTPLELASLGSRENSDESGALFGLDREAAEGSSGTEDVLSPSRGIEASPAETTPTPDAVSIGPSADALLRTSPFLQGLLNRVEQLELAQRQDTRLTAQLAELSACVAHLRRDVDLLLESATGSEATSSAPEPDALRRLSAQLDALSGNVSHLMSVQNSQQSAHSPTFSRNGSELGSRTRSVSPVEVLRKPSAQLSPIIADSFSARNSPLVSSSSYFDSQSAAHGGKVTWQDVGLPTSVAHSAIQSGFGEGPTGISATSIVHMMREVDIVAHTPAVRDRLATIILPSVAFLQTDSSDDSIQVLVVSSNFEQASQIHRWYLSLGVRASISSANIDLPAELANLQTRVPDILIGTPERLLDLLALRALPMHMLRLLVIDEADVIIARNLANFASSLVRILPPSQRPNGRQTVILGSTVPNEVLLFASSLGLREPVRVLVKKEQAAAGVDTRMSVRNLRHHYLYVAMASRGVQATAWKLEAISDMLEDIQFRHCVVWCNSPESVDAVTQTLSLRGLDVHSLHEEVAPLARQAILTHFATSQQSPKRILVLSEALTGNIADLPRSPLVVNYELPSCPEDYVHRVSCIAAAGYARPGVAVSLITNDHEIGCMRHIEAFYRIQIPELPPNLSSLA